MIRLGTRTIGRASALIFGIAAVTAACGDNGVTPPDAAPDSPPAPAVLAITPMTNSFGSVTVGNTSAAASFTITNTAPAGGSATGTITPILTGTGAGEFTVTNGCSTLQAQGTCTVTVAFKPTSAGGKQANLVVSASPGGSVMANLDGSGVPVSSLTLNPGSQAFGTQIVGVAVTNNDKTFTITNGGGTPSGALTVTAAGSDPGEFSKQMDTCSGQMVAAGATCTLVIRFAPLSSGAKSASFDIVGNPGGILHAQVSGIAQTQASIELTPSVQDYGSVIIGQTSQIVYTVTNTGGQTTGALANTLTGTDAAQFSIPTSSCAGATLAAGATCNITVRFSPTGAAGARNAQLNVTGTPGGTDTSILSGTAILPGQITPMPGSIPFGPITVGQNSTAQNITITNGGGSATGALTVGITGPNAAEFPIVGANGCQGAVLAAGGTCTFSVRFSPTSAGTAKSANVAVTGTPGGTANISLTGDGISPAQLVSNPPSKDFGSVTTGTTSATQTFTITNSGGQTSAAVNPALAGANAAEFTLMNTSCSGTLAPAASCDVIVAFAPTSTGVKAATLTFSGGSAALSGTGISPAQITANPTSLTFAGNTLLGSTTLAQSFTVTNNGASTTGTLAVTITGANAGDFAQTNNCTTLAQNATCQVNVTFAPTAAGLRGATVNVTGTPGGTVGVAVAGTGQRPLEITQPNVNPFDFGTVGITTFSNCVEVRLRNNTAMQITLGMTFPANMSFGNVAGADFDLNNGAAGCGNPPGTNCVNGLVMAAGDDCGLFVDASPDAPGAVTGFVRFAIGAATTGPNVTQQDFTAVGNTNSIVITPCTAGNCTNAATPAFNYGNVLTGQTLSQTFTVTNQLGAATVGNIEVQQTSGAQDFHLVADMCSGAPLANNGTCTFTVIFAPVNNGGATGSVRARDIAATNPLATANRNLSGNGQQAAALALTCTTNCSFGTVNIGEQSVIRTYTLDNTAGAGGQATGPINITMNSAQYTLLTGAAGDCVSGTTTLPAGTGTGSTCNVRLRFDPTVVHEGTTPVPFSLTANATPGGIATDTTNPGNSRSTINIAAVTNVTYGDVPLGLTQDRFFTITNNSATQTLTFQMGVASDGAFTVTANGCATLAPNGNCMLGVRFAPVAPAGNHTNVTFTVNMTNGQASIGGLNGFGRPNASISVNPATYDFGSILAGGLGTPPNVIKTFTVSNVGWETSGAISFTTSGSTAYSVVPGGTCVSGTTTLVGAQNAGTPCTINVRFAPMTGQTGTLTGALNITVPAGPGNSASSALTGNGLANASLTVVNNTVADPEFGTPTDDFGARALNTMSATTTFQVNNTGGAAVTLAIAVPANFARDTTVANNCGATLNAGATCIIGVRFVPTATGPVSGQLTVVAGVYAALNGIGISNPNFTGLTDQAYGPVEINTFVDRVLTISNANQGNTGLLTSTLSGVQANQFSVLTTGCNAGSAGNGMVSTANLTPGGTCQLTVRFLPTTTGAKTATLTLTSANGLSVVATLTGTGVNPPLIAITGTVSADGNRPVFATDAAPTVFTVSNAVGSAQTGPIALTLSDAANFVFVAPGTGTPCSTSATVSLQTRLADGASCTVAIAYNPTALGAATTNLTATAGAPGGGTQTVTGAVTGTGTEFFVTTNTLNGMGRIDLTANMNTVITFRNNSNLTTAPVQTDITGLGSQIALIADGCFATALAPNATCAVTVRYVPDGTTNPTGGLLRVTANATSTVGTYGVAVTRTSGYGTTPNGGAAVPVALQFTP